jgi:Flp pilus assembly protein TadB
MGSWGQGPLLFVKAWTNLRFVLGESWAIAWTRSTARLLVTSAGTVLLLWCLVWLLLVPSVLLLLMLLLVLLLLLLQPT